MVIMMMRRIIIKYLYILSWECQTNVKGGPGEGWGPLGEVRKRIVSFHWIHWLVGTVELLTTLPLHVPKCAWWFFLFCYCSSAHGHLFLFNLWMNCHAGWLSFEDLLCWLHYKYIYLCKSVLKFIWFRIILNVFQIVGLLSKVCLC